MSYLLALLMTLFGSLGAFFFKKSTGSSPTLQTLLRNVQLYAGGAFYLAGALINILLLHHLEYSVVYPMTAITYIWTMLISCWFLGEKISKRKVAGILTICLGVLILVQ